MDCVFRSNGGIKARTGLAFDPRCKSRVFSSKHIDDHSAAACKSRVFASKRVSKHMRGRPWITWSSDPPRLHISIRSQSWKKAAHVLPYFFIHRSDCVDAASGDVWRQLQALDATSDGCDYCHTVMRPADWETPGHFQLELCARRNPLAWKKLFDLSEAEQLWPNESIRQSCRALFNGRE